MPQRPTTHKDLHRAALGSVFSLVYLLAISPAWAQNGPTAASSRSATRSQPTRLVKNEPAKPQAAMPVKVSAQGKSADTPAQPTAQISAPEVKPPQTKGGKLREIPLSTLNGDKKAATPATANVSAKADTKPPAKADNAPDKKKESTQANKKQSTSPRKTASVKEKKTTTSVPRLNNGLIPPPPPIVPIGMDVLGMYAQPVDYLSMKDLEARKKELSVRFNELDANVKDGLQQIQERKERAELFESLYKEGVVSRKELEIAKRESGEIDRDFKFKQDELESVKLSMKAVNNRLAVLKKMESKMISAKEKKNKSLEKKQNTKKN